MLKPILLGMVEGPAACNMVSVVCKLVGLNTVLPCVDISTAGYLEPAPQTVDWSPIAIWYVVGLVDKTCVPLGAVAPELPVK